MRQLFMSKEDYFVGEDAEIITRDGDVEYTVQRVSKEAFSSYIVYNNQELEVAKIERKNEGMVPSFNVLVEDEVMFNVEQIVTPLARNYQIEGRGLAVYDDWSNMNFDIMLGYRKVAKIRNRWVSSGDAYEITVFEEEYENAVIGLFVLLASLVQEEQMSFA